MIKYEEVKKLVVKTGVEMLQSNMVAGTWGNISARISAEELMAITPSGMDYNELTTEDITIIDFNGNVIDGSKKPSSEWEMHCEIYKNRKEVNAIVHTHSQYATAFALARKPIPAAAEDLVQIVGGDVRVCEYKLPGTIDLGKSVVKGLEGRNSAILANHGVVAIGANLNETLKTAIIVEKAAKEVIYANLLGGVVLLSDEDVNIMRNYYINSYGQK